MNELKAARLIGICEAIPKSQTKEQQIITILTEAMANIAGNNGPQIYNASDIARDALQRADKAGKGEV